MGPTFTGKTDQQGAWVALSAERWLFILAWARSQLLGSGPELGSALGWALHSAKSAPDSPSPRAPPPRPAQAHAL